MNGLCRGSEKKSFVLLLLRENEMELYVIMWWRGSHEVNVKK